MANITRKQILNQAIADFDSIESAIEECGVDVPYDTDTNEYGGIIKQLYQKGVNDGVSGWLRPATESDLGGIIIGENLSVTADGTATVKTANGISTTNKLPAKSSDVAKSIDGAYLTNEEIDALLANFN